MFTYSNGAQPVNHDLLVDRGLFPSRPRGVLEKIRLFVQWLLIN